MSANFRPAGLRWILFLLVMGLLSACGTAATPGPVPTVQAVTGATTPATVAQPTSGQSTTPTTTSQTTTPTPVQPSGAAQKVTLAFPGPGTLIFLPYEVARAQGYFAQQGIDIEFAYTKGGPPAVSALNSNSLSFVGTTIDLALNSYKQDKTIVMVSSLTRLPAFAVVTSPKNAGTINSLKDLEGKSVGITNVGAGDQLILTFLIKKQGADPSKVNFAAIGPDDAKINALNAGQIDAAILQEPALSLITAKGGRILANLYDKQQATAAFGSGYQFTGLVTRPDVIQSQPELVQKMVNAVVAAEQYIAGHSGEEIVKSLPDEVIVGGNRANYAAVVDKYKDTIYSKDGKIMPDEVQLVARVQQESGALTGKLPDMTLFYTNKFVEAVKK